MPFKRNKILYLLIIFVCTIAIIVYHKYLQKLDIDSCFKMQLLQGNVLPSFVDSGLIAAGITAAGAIIGNILANKQAEISNRREKWEILFNSLEWFGTDPNLRSTAISVVETKWRYHDDFCKRWALIFVTQIIYILKSYDSTNTEAELSIERVNLSRMMNLLISVEEKNEKNKTFAEDLSCQDIQFIIEAITKYSQDSKTFLSIEEKIIKSWKDELEKKLKNREKQRKQLSGKLRPHV